MIGESYGTLCTEFEYLYLLCSGALESLCLMISGI